MTAAVDWPAYYAVTVDRPPWQTTLLALDRFAAERGDAAARGDASARADPAAQQDAHDAPFAVDLGCGAGRDTREMLRRGWRVLAVDREVAAIEALLAATPARHRPRLETAVADLATFAVPPCDLVNANISLPFLPPDAYAAAWSSIVAAVPSGARVSSMLFGDQDESATDPSMTCPSPAAMRAILTDFEIEHWSERVEDGQTALGEPHHFHIVELVARRR
jgi:SAM-dependent methyltransferase